MGYRKPSPARAIIFEEALKALGTSSRETAFVGDSLYHDVQGAKAVGMKTVWLKRKTSDTEKITAILDKIIQNLTELPKTLEAL